MLKTSWLLSVALIASIAGGMVADAGAQEIHIPNFSSITSGWLLNGGIDWFPRRRQASLRSVTIPPIPLARGNQRGVMERMSDAENTNLTDWAKGIMRKYNKEVLDGHRAFTSQARCWPGGVPGQMLFPAEPIFFIQTPKEVWIMWQRDQHVRRIYLNQPHSQNVKPSWNGKSVGRYENGELVVDTIGVKEHEFGFVDNWRTPHTKDMHVVERWKVVDNGKAIEATVTVDDPGAFKQPWTGRARWEKVDRGAMLSRSAPKTTANSRSSSTCANTRCPKRKPRTSDHFSSGGGKPNSFAGFTLYIRSSSRCVMPLARSPRAASTRQSVGYTFVIWPQSVETMMCSAPIFLTSAAAAALCARVL